MKRELIELAEEDERAQLLAPQWAKQHMLDKMANARNKLNRSASVLGAMGMSFGPPPGMMAAEKVPETKEEEPEGPKRVEFVLGRSQRPAKPCRTPLYIESTLLHSFNPLRPCFCAILRQGSPLAHWAIPLHGRHATARLCRM